MVKAVRYDEFGGIDVLRVEEVERPVPGDRQVLIRVKAAGINPSEAVIRMGAVAELFPSTFPSGQGSDLAGVTPARRGRPRPRPAPALRRVLGTACPAEPAARCGSGRRR